jgi:putative endopeptidase
MAAPAARDAENVSVHRDHQWELEQLETHRVLEIGGGSLGLVLRPHRLRRATAAAVAASCLCLAAGLTLSRDGSVVRHVGLAMAAAVVSRAGRPRTGTYLLQADEPSTRAAFLEHVRQELLLGAGAAATSSPDAAPDSGEPMSGDVTKAMNFSVDPCDNFYEYVCGQWVEETAIPPDKPIVIKSWDLARELVTQQMAELFQDSQRASRSEEGRQLFDYFAACMDTARVNQLGAEPIMPLLNKIDAIASKEALQDMIAELTAHAMPSLIRYDVQVDNHNRSRHVIKIKDAGMTLPDYTYYLANPLAHNDTFPPGEGVGTGKTRAQTEADAQWHRLNYASLQKEFASLNRLTGLSAEAADATAQETMDIETRIASLWSQEPFQYYIDHFPGGLPDVSLATLEVSMPHLPWRLTLAKLVEECGIYNASCNALRAVVEGEDGAADAEIFNMDMPAYFRALSQAIDDHPPQSWIPILRSHVVKQWAPLLGRKFEQVMLVAGRAITGVSKAPERWHKCSNAAMNALPYAADLAYRELYFPASAMEEGQTLMEDIKISFLANMEAVDWLGDNETSDNATGPGQNVTRERAIAKAKKLSMFLGGTQDPYYIHFPVSATDYFNNALHAFCAKQLATYTKLALPVARNKWEMTAFAVNAYYDRSRNALYIPAGVMQPPFFFPYFAGSLEARAARNYGGIGTVMGHEFSHGFDNEGAQFDEQSERNTWWSEKVTAEFKEKTDCIRRLYDGWRINGVFVDGQKTEPENIADHGGLKVALEALKARLYALSHESSTPGGRVGERDTRTDRFSAGSFDRYSTKHLISSAAHIPSVNLNTNP